MASAPVPATQPVYDVGQDCPRCRGVGYQNPQRGKAAALLGAYLPTVSLLEPDAIAPHVARPRAPVEPCPACLGSGVWMTGEALEECLAAVAYNVAWVQAQGLLPDGTDTTTLGTALQNLRDLLDTGAPVLLRAEEVKRLYGAYLAVRFDAERRLGAVSDADGDDAL